MNAWRVDPAGKDGDYLPAVEDTQIEVGLTVEAETDVHFSRFLFLRGETRRPPAGFLSGGRRRIEVNRAQRHRPPESGQPEVRRRRIYGSKIPIDQVEQMCFACCVSEQAWPLPLKSLASDPGVFQNQASLSRVFMSNADVDLSRTVRIVVFPGTLFHAGPLVR